MKIYTLTLTVADEPEGLAEKLISLWPEHILAYSVQGPYDILADALKAENGHKWSRVKDRREDTAK